MAGIAQHADTIATGALGIGGTVLADLINPEMVQAVTQLLIAAVTIYKLLKKPKVETPKANGEEEEKAN